MASSGDRLLRLIAVFKFFKAALLIGVGLGAFQLIHRNVAVLLQHWIEVFKLAPGNHFLDVALAKAADLRPDQIRNVGLGSFVYAALFLAEGSGLWMQKRWGEWLTVIITGSLIPLEVYEIFRHPNGLKVAALAVNIAIVIYLIWHMRRGGSGKH